MIIELQLTIDRTGESRGRERACPPQGFCVAAARGTSIWPPSRLPFALPFPFLSQSSLSLASPLRSRIKSARVIWQSDQRRGMEWNRLFVRMRRIQGGQAIRHWSCRCYCNLDLTRYHSAHTSFVTRGTRRCTFYFFREGFTIREHTESERGKEQSGKSQTASERREEVEMGQWRRRRWREGRTDGRRGARE